MTLDMTNATAEQWDRYWRLTHALQDASQAAHDRDQEMYANAALRRDTDLAPEGSSRS